MPRPGMVLVNIGDALQSVSKGRFKATCHRVRNIGEERYSLPYFFHPSFDSKFEFFKDGDSDATSITYGPWVIQKLKSIPDFKHLPDF